MGTFCQVYCDNLKRRAKQKNLKNVSLGQKTVSKTGTKESVVVKDIRVSKEVNAFLRNHRKDGWRASGAGKTTPISGSRT